MWGMKVMRAVFAVLSVMMLASCASQTSYSPSEWPTETAKKVIRVQDGERWSRTLAMPAVEGLSSRTLFSKKPKRSDFESDLVQALGDSGLLALPYQQPSFDVNVAYSTHEIPLESGKSTEQHLVNFQIVNLKTSNIVYDGMFDATPKAKHKVDSRDIVKAFMVNFAAQERLGMYEVLPCGGRAGLQNRKLELLMSGTRVMSTSC